MKFPILSEYNSAIQKYGGSVLKKYKNLEFQCSRSVPVKIYAFTSGAFAVVFKGIYLGKEYAIRCFLSADLEKLVRYRAIQNHLAKVNESWKIEFEFIDDEITVDGKSFPILKMDWIHGVKINEFVDKFLYDNEVLSRLQEQLVSLCESLERNQIGHGDLQSGNLLITGDSKYFTIKLIDYDGMFVPELAYKNSLEGGRSEFQHPKRSIYDFNSEIDRFSIWVMITAIEAIKEDKSLWKQVMQGGFNTLDNFLFTIQDFLNPDVSPLFIRLKRNNSEALKFYVETLTWLCRNSISAIPKPALFSGKATGTGPKPDEGFLPASKVRIVSLNSSAAIFSTTLQKIGDTPLELDANTYLGKTVLVTNGSETKRIVINSYDRIIEVKFN